MPDMGHLGKVGARLRRSTVAVAALTIVVGAGPGLATASAADQSRAYELVHGCFAVKSLTSGTFVARAGSGWKASAADAGAAEHFRMQATDLGRYMFYSTAKDLMAGTSGGAMATQAAGSPTADWRVLALEGGGFRISLPDVGRTLTATSDGTLKLVSGAASGDTAGFDFVKAEGCEAFPEITTNVDGAPSRGSTDYTETRGFLDGHLHHMAFEFLGGSLHCGRPWHRYGVAVALPDCNNDVANGGSARGDERRARRQPVDRRGRLADVQQLAQVQRARLRGHATGSGWSAPGRAACGCSPTSWWTTRRCATSIRPSATAASRWTRCAWS